MSIQIKLIVTATNTRKYASVEFGTYEVEFDIDELAKIAPKPMRWVKRIDNEAGVTQDGRLAFLSDIEITPRVLFGKPINPEDPLDLKKRKG